MLPGNQGVAVWSRITLREGGGQGMGRGQWSAFLPEGPGLGDRAAVQSGDDVTSSQSEGKRSLRINFTVYIFCPTRVTMTGCE